MKLKTIAVTTVILLQTAAIVGILFYPFECPDDGWRARYIDLREYTFEQLKPERDRVVDEANDAIEQHNAMVTRYNEMAVSLADERRAHEQLRDKYNRLIDLIDRYSDEEK